MDKPPLYCVSCGMPSYDLSVLGACPHCGVFGQYTTSLRLIQWEIALTWNDKKMLRSMKISPE